MLDLADGRRTQEKLSLFQNWRRVKLKPALTLRTFQMKCLVKAIGFPAICDSKQRNRIVEQQACSHLSAPAYSGPAAFVEDVGYKPDQGVDNSDASTDGHRAGQRPSDTTHGHKAKRLPNECLGKSASAAFHEISSSHCQKPIALILAAVYSANTQVKLYAAL